MAEDERSVDQRVDESFDKLLDRVDAALDNPDLPAHVLGRLSSVFLQLKKAERGKGETETPAAAQLGPALKALPPERSLEILDEEIGRLTEVLASYHRLRDEIQIEVVVVPEAMPA